MLQQFQIEEEQQGTTIRTSAERIAGETRRSRREFNGTVLHLQLDTRVVEELSQKGHLCWVNDDLKGSMRMYEQIGYRYITNREAYGAREDLEPEDRVCVRFGTADKDNHPQDIYLMIQPWAFYEEDQAEIQKANDKIDKQIVEGDNISPVKGEQRKVKYER